MPVSASHNPVEDLVGTEFGDGWVIARRIPRPGSAGAEDLTGSCFSVGYIAVRKGQEAFLKAIDVQRAITITDAKLPLMQRLKLVTDSHTFECAILDICKKARLDRIVSVIGSGDLPPPKGSFAPVPYILFEMADADVRKIVSRSDRLDDAWRLHVLHDVAVGLQQLHGQKIAHQDLKPSNVLVFPDDKKKAKIGDLGRSSRQGLESSHDSNTIAGAIQYAPPEQVFGQIPVRWEDRREGCDLYHLGSMVTYLFSGITPTDYYCMSLEREIRPRVWGGGYGKSDYKASLPLLQAAFSAFLAKVRQDFPDWAADELTTIVLHSCNPDFERRGDPKARSRFGSPLGIETFVSRFDRLSKRAQVELRREPAP